MLLSSSGFQNMVFCCRLENLTETWLLLCIYCCIVITWIWNAFTDLSTGGCSRVSWAPVRATAEKHIWIGWYWYGLGVAHGKDGKGQDGSNLAWGLLWFFFNLFFLFLFSPCLFLSHYLSTQRMLIFSFLVFTTTTHPSHSSVATVDEPWQY